VEKKKEIMKEKKKEIIKKLEILNLIHNPIDLFEEKNVQLHVKILKSKCL